MILQYSLLFYHTFSGVTWSRPSGNTDIGYLVFAIVSVEVADAQIQDRLRSAANETVSSRRGKGKLKLGSVDIADFSSSFC
jgi:hypothetical protein